MSENEKTVIDFPFANADRVRNEGEAPELYVAMFHATDDEGELKCLAVAKDLPGCVGYGPTEEDARADLEERIDTWLVVVSKMEQDAKNEASSQGGAA